MADALVSPAVGGAVWAATAAATLYCAKKVREEMDDRKVPLMGVLGAFIFAAQMLNFTIPAAGSSGHLGGGMILAILLGPYAAFIVMASVLAVQALFFADGGLLALGCNILNLGFFPCFIGYPLIYSKIAGKTPTQGRIMAGAMISSIIGLQLGAFGVVLETVASGVSELPFGTFVLLMLPIHLAIGIVEGLATAAVVTFVWREQPDILLRASSNGRPGAAPLKKVLAVLGVFAVLAGGVLSWFASTDPDGLEWSIAKITGKGELERKESGVHAAMEKLQEKTTLLPDYGFKKPEGEKTGGENPPLPPEAGTSAAGLVGGGVTLLIAAFFAWVLKRRNRPAV
jgi:cobalt/nickel transport system permease protein